MEVNELITLVEDDGEERNLIVAHILDMKRQQYAVLVDKETQDLDKAEIYRIEFEDEGGETLVEIEDRDEFNLVNEKLDMVIEEENEGGY
jgi:uncharacterized protein YrzB (UPF0473 family)